MHDVGLASKQERINVLNQRGERLADGVVPVRDGPATALEATFGVFVGATGSLHHAIKGQEF
jgi:hypothetical protein